MLNKLKIQIVYFLSGFCFVTALLAQDETPDISQIKYLYEELRFEEAINFGQNLLEEKKIQTAQHLEYIHLYMAFSFYNTGKLDSSRVHFLALLTVNPEIQLDVLDISPKIIEFFNKIRSNLKEVNNNVNVLSYPEYIFIEDKRPDAAWRSAVLPGWGQYYKGQQARAYIFGGTFITSATILAISLINENKYKDAYLNSTEPADISSNYDKYSDWSKIRQMSTYTTVGIWLLSFADAIWSDYPRISINYSGSDNMSGMISVRYFF